MPDKVNPARATGTKGDEARDEAARVLRRLLAAVESGELEADSAHAKALLRRIEGAVVGLEAPGVGEPEP